MIKYLILLSSILFTSCTSLYVGNHKLNNFNVHQQPNELGPEVQLWEDGLRTEKKNNQLEWWYFDGKLPDGTIIVCYFWKVHFISDRYFIGVNYTTPNGYDNFKIKFFKESEVSFSKDSCNVKMGSNSIIGNLESYQITIDPNDFDGIGFDVILKSNSLPYRPQDGIIKAGSNYFAWLSAVPNGDFEGKLTFNSKTKQINGSGYHDHNWGNTPLQKLFKSWMWFRGEAGPYTIITSELNAVDGRGGYNIPILYIADNKKVLVNRFGEDGLFTKKSQLIEGVYRKQNEPLFSNLELMTEDGFQVKIKGENIIDNTLLFDRIKTILPISRLMNIFNIDPHYTRFKSKLVIKDTSGAVHEGFGILEIMDLK